MTESAPVAKRRGELRIYLGAAPGVGKTYAMLAEARRRLGRGTDVVVGFVETYGRAKTDQLLDGLEIIPRRTVSYRSTELAEMDLDAVLARKPEVACVDELAHTNAPGSRNTKRWQDIDALLDAGIDVLSTVNIQHLESLNDVVEQITGVKQRETVPDAVVRRADQVELADITPEALRRRMAHGNIYPAQKIDAALSHYFRTGNLTALRELALLWVADQVDVGLQRYRADHRIAETWEARERVVVGITGGPESETLIRRARRIANRAGAELLAVHVLRGDGLAGAAPEAITRCRELAEDVGATFHTVVGDDVRAALLDFARGVNATQLVVGTSRRSRFARVLDEGIGAATVQDSGPIDVHMVTHEEAGRGRRWRRLRSALTPHRQACGWALALLLPALVTALGTLMRTGLVTSTTVVGYFLAIVVAAIVGGMGPALLAAVVSGGLFNFFFTAPLYTLAIADPENVVTLVGMVLVGLMVAVIVDRAARRAEQAARARMEATLMASYARTVLTHPQPVDGLLQKVRENFALSSVAMLERRDGQWECAAAVGSDPCGKPDEGDADIVVNPDVHLALRGRPLPASDQAILEAAAGQALLALRQQRMAAEAAEAHQLAEANKLRTALLSAVGHDLRTPLASIKAALDSLTDSQLALSEADRAELLTAIEESTNRLRGLVDNLLDSSRLATGAIEPARTPITYAEVVAGALAGIDERPSIVVDIDETVPPVLADPGLLERVIDNLIDNALRHGCRDNEPAEITVSASTYADRVELRVADRGPGLPKYAADSLFTPFQRRGDRDTTSGVGLGLNVAKGFVEAMGGSIRAEDTPGGGLTFVISLPAAGAPARTSSP